MTLSEVRELFAYNAWANRRIFAALAALAPAAYVRDLKSSHGGVHGTLCHIVWAERLWLHRWLGRPNPAVAQGKDLATLAAAVARWSEVETERAAFLASLRDDQLTATLTVHPSAGGTYVHTLGQTLRHVVDHSSYHRGQIVTLLRQLGVTPPNTGLITWDRERGLTPER